MKKTLSLFSLCLFLSISSIAQELISNNGAYYSNANGSLTWSVGEAVITTISDGTDTLTQGFHQSRFSFVSIYESYFEDISVIIYPNPTANQFSIDINTSDISGFTYTMFDLNGKLLCKKEIANNITDVDMQNYPAATYYVSVYKDGISVKATQIIKNY
ncbi:hypothetical protein C0581_04930 [Candidatus Parcubacteria bacterium]|nr:MAG: hypothetical protein C0581_04930 [Candidatus Parcubacteria bacterium]